LETHLYQNRRTCAAQYGDRADVAPVFDIDKDGVNDFVITERTVAPSVVWYRRGPNGWTHYVIEAEPLHIEAGTTFADVDGDGDLDLVAGGDYKSNEVWWWENPYPNYNPNVPWKRHVIKNSMGAKHHDLAFGDFYGNGAGLIRDEIQVYNFFTEDEEISDEWL
jgi:hypothetical protein